jgi:hypothetical protein
LAAEIEKHTKLARVFINACNKEFEINQGSHKKSVS